MMMMMLPHLTPASMTSKQTSDKTNRMTHILIYILIYEFRIYSYEFINKFAPGKRL